MVLIRATRAAAAGPLRNRVGSVQKVGSAAKIDIAVTAMMATVSAGDPAYSAKGMETAPTTAGTVMCQVRIPRRVASRDQKYMTTAAGWCGSAITRTCSKTSNVVTSFFWNP